MNPTIEEVVQYMEGFEFNGEEFLNRRGKITLHVPLNSAASFFCYSKEESRTNADGIILNEMGKPARKGNIILRAGNGYPFKRMEE